MGKIMNLFISFAVAITMTGCNEKGDEYVGDSSAVIVDPELELVSPSDAFPIDCKGKSHIKAADNIVNLTADISEVYTFDVEGCEGDYTQFCDALGEYYFGYQYDSSAWKVSETTTLDGFKTKDAFYSPKEYNGMLHVSDSALFVYQPEGRTFAFDIQFGIGNLLKDDNTEYVLTDKSKVTYAEAVKLTDKLIKGFDLAEGQDASQISQVMYDHERKAIKVDYLPKVHGIKLSKIRNDVILNEATFENDALGIRTSNTFPTKEAYVFASGDDGAFIIISAYKFKTVNETAHDKIVSLQSAIDYLDKHIAPNLKFEIKRTELKYLLPADEVKQENGAIRLDTHGIPVWEIILYEPDQQLKYVFVMDALTGKSSLIRLNNN